MKGIMESCDVENEPIAGDDFGHTFCQDLSESDLQLDTYHDRGTEKHQEEGPSVRFSISHVSKLKYFAEQTKAFQIFYVGQRRSYSRLLMTRELFRQFVRLYFVFPAIWDFIQPFGFKTRNCSMGSSPCRVLHTKHIGSKDSRSFECAYSFRYVVLNQRRDSEDPLPDYDRWSIRHTVVYQQYNGTKDRTMFLLVAPSTASRDKLQDSLLSACAHSPGQICPFELHQILISTHHENWRRYIADLEKYLQYQSDRVTLANVNGYLTMPFLDRQRLKMIEDKILDLKIIFGSLSHTLSRLKKQCQVSCVEGLCVTRGCVCPNAVDDLDEQLQEIEVNMEQIEVLHRRAQATAQIVSDALSYENAKVTNLNAKSLHELAQESREENSKMRVLTERSTRDAAAVKILTVITLIYLPVTVVASIFSSQLIQVDDNGRISVISESWWFIVISLPLTAFTFLLWRYWLSHTMGTAVYKSEDQNKDSEAYSSSPSRGSTIAELSRRLHSFQNKESRLAVESMP